MGFRLGFGLKFLQEILRAITFGSAIVVLGIYGYFLATMHSHGLFIPTWVRAVEGLAGAAALYSLIGLLLLWCLAGHRLASFIAIVLDLLFIAGFVYIASANRGGAGRCRGRVRTPFGTADSRISVVDDGHGGFIKLPSFHTACKLETACLAVSVIAIIFLILSCLNEMLLARNHRREHLAGNAPVAASVAAGGPRARRLGLFGRGRRSANANTDPNVLPTHANPGQYANVEAGTAKGFEEKHPQ